jgi:nicotinate phosphoribosyltransferase
MSEPRTRASAPDRRSSHEERCEALHAGLARFPASLFQFDPRIAEGWLTDRYFLRSVGTLAMAGRDPEVTLQVFAKRDGVLAGVYEVLRLIETQLPPEMPGGRPCDAARCVRVETLLEGDRVAPWETAMLIHAPYRCVAHLETPLLGTLARRSLVATNVRRVIDAAAGRTVIFMGARHDDWRVQTADGYAAQVGGVRQVSSDAGGAWWGARGVGTVPHALLAAFGGDVAEATLAFARYVRRHEPDVGIVSLVDYHNDVVADSLAVARAMRDEFGPGVLRGVRVDTSERLIDRSLQDVVPADGERLTGVNERLVRVLRARLDEAGFADVGIVVSGGFTPARIRAFEASGVPVMAYGVGSSLLGHNHGEVDGLLTSFDFTADIVTLDGRPESKVGRELHPNPRLVAVDWQRAGADAAASVASTTSNPDGS